MSKVLVTGALGNVGLHLVNKAEAQGFKVKAAGTRPEALDRQFGASVETVYFDFTNPATFSEALDAVSLVFLMRPPHLGKAEDLKPFIDALAKQPGLKLVCFLSLQGIEKNPIPPHYKIEKMLEAAKLPYCHMRPSFFMQNLSGIHAFEIKHLNQIFVPVGKAKTSFIDAEDIALAICEAFKQPERHKGKAYTLTGPEALSYYEAAEIFSRCLNKPVGYSKPGFYMAFRYWTQLRQIDKAYAKVMVMLYGMTYLGTAATVSQELEGLIGQKATTLEGFIQKNIEAWQ